MRGALATKRALLGLSLTFFLCLYVLCVYFLFGCNSKNEDGRTTSGNKLEFSWKEKLTKEDIPDFDVKSFLNGKEVKFEYINFERWHGPNDNVINFSLSKPEQPCGYIENFTGFRIIRKGKEISQGEFSKPNFSSALDSYEAVCYYLSPDGATHSSDAQWNCVFVIENSSDKEVIGRIALCFNDPAKSWLAGKFTAKVCNN